MKDSVFIKKGVESLNIVLIMSIIASVVLLAVYVEMGKWKKARKEVYCTYTEQFNLPLIFDFTKISETKSTSKLLMFVSEYVRLKYNHSVTDYFQVVSGARYKDAALKKNLLQVIEMSELFEKAANMKEYSQSDEILAKLKACSCSWVFNIHKIEDYQEVPKSGVVHVSVIGEFQRIFDKNKVQKEPTHWDYARINFDILQGAPTKDVSGRDLNIHGLFVIRSWIEPINYDERFKLLKR